MGYRLITKAPDNSLTLGTNKAGGAFILQADTAQNIIQLNGTGGALGAGAFLQSGYIGIQGTTVLGGYGTIGPIRSSDFFATGQTILGLYFAGGSYGALAHIGNTFIIGNDATLSFPCAVVEVQAYNTVSISIGGSAVVTYAGITQTAGPLYVNFHSVAANYTIDSLTPGDQQIWVTADCTLQLPNPAAFPPGRVLEIIINYTPGALVIARHSTEKINGVAGNLTLGAGSAFSVIEVRTNAIDWVIAT